MDEIITDYPDKPFIDIILKYLMYLGLFAVVGGVISYGAIRWGNEHKIVWQKMVRIETQAPIRIEDVKQEIISPIVKVVEDENATPIEQKVYDLWGYREGALALAIFECGESGLNQYAVSHTGDLGIAQIHWPTHRQMIEEMGYTSADVLEDVNVNLEIAYRIWDRGDGTEGNGEGNFNAWVGYTNGAYLRCFK